MTSIAAFRAVLDGLEDKTSVRGVAKLPKGERVALALPDGDVGAADDTKFVDWLRAHSEPAPFGDGTKTKIDKKVRAAERLIARDKVTVHGFDPTVILDDIAAVLSPTWELAAKLTDVITYAKGGKFARHKDTPRDKALIGTLVVGLPVEHAGGAFHVDDGRAPVVADWSGKPAAGALPWIALFSDVDHEIKPVTSGTRVTLVYALHRTERARADAGAAKRGDVLRAACKTLAAPSKWPLMIACGRAVIAEPEVKQPQGIETLRGADREIADALVAAGYHVAVRACIAALPNYDVVPPAPGAFPNSESMWAVTRLKAMPPAGVFEAMGDESSASAMEPYLLDSIPLEQQWIVRKHAAATLVQEAGMWAEGGYFGNESYDALLYTTAALEVTTGKPAAAKKKPAAKKPKPKTKTKS